MNTNWRPSAAIDQLRRRAGMLALIRRFMEERAIMEVETPVLSWHGNTDPQLAVMTAAWHAPGAEVPHTLYLNTSPEFGMKRLLAAGSGPVYQIARVFRDGEAGRYHNPEFTLLEWYRPGFDHHDLMDEVVSLLAALGIHECARLAYAEAFEAATGLNPHTAADQTLRTHATSLGLSGDDSDRTLLLDFLFSHEVAPSLARGAVLIHDFPACQAALARLRVNPDGIQVASRFELLIDGIEIANGFHELSDAAEQAGRFEADNARRLRSGLPRIPVDDHLLAALAHGLPDCAGVAVGLDRLLMHLCDVASIDDVLAFGFRDA